MSSIELLQERAIKFDGQEIRLTKNQYACFRHLWIHKGFIAEREALRAAVWGFEQPSSNALEVTVYQIRRILRKYKIPIQIKMVTQVGYKLTVTDEQLLIREHSNENADQTNTAADNVPGAGNEAGKTTESQNNA